MATVTEARIAGRLDNTLNLVLTGLLLFWLITTSGAIFPVLAIGGGGIEMDEATRSKLRLLLLPSLAMAPLLVLLRFRAILRLLLQNPFLVFLLVWIAISIVWSLAPDVTMRRVVSLLSNTMIVCFLVVDRDIERILKLLSSGFLVLLVTSAAFILLRPDLGVMPDGRGLRGAFIHKNLMGETVVLSLIVFAAALKAGAISRWMGMAGFGLGLVLLVPVGAASSIVVGVVVLAVQMQLLTQGLSFRQRAVILAFGVALAIAAIGVMVANADALLGLLGRDVTLTGRTDVWHFVLQTSAERPWLGYGYASIFEVESVAHYLVEAYGWAIPSAHNGYLETLLGNGVIGVLLLFCFFATMVYRLVVGWRRYSPAAIMFVLPTLTFILLLNLTESNMLASSGLTWTTLLIASLILTPDLRSG